MDNPRRYPALEINLGAIQNNAARVTALCGEGGISVCGVIKCYDGDLDVAEAFARGGCAQLGSSWWEHLRGVKERLPEVETMLLRMPMACETAQVVRWCDISLNTERSTLERLSREAVAQNKTHGVLLMYDIGNLREGVMDREELVEVAAFAEALPGIRLRGVGSTFECYGSVLPGWDNLTSLRDAARAIEARLGRRLEMVSGGSSITLPLVCGGQVPQGVNHLRVGGGIGNPMHMITVRGNIIDGLRTDTFLLEAQVIERNRKPTLPFGDISVDGFGKAVAFQDRGVRARAICALGDLDVHDGKALLPVEPGVTVLGGSSDHLILDIQDAQREIAVGDILSFRMTYLPLMGACSSRRVTRYIVTDRQPSTRV